VNWDRYEKLAVLAETGNISKSKTEIFNAFGCCNLHIFKDKAENVSHGNIQILTGWPWVTLNIYFTLSFVAKRLCPRRSLNWRVESCLEDFARSHLRNHCRL